MAVANSTTTPAARGMAAQLGGLAGTGTYMRGKTYTEAGPERCSPFGMEIFNV
jgi:hypothetical protein